MRILMVSDVSPLHIAGGAERVLWEEASRLHRRGHRVRVLSRAPSGDDARCERDGVAVRQFPVDQRSPLRFLVDSIRASRRALLDALREEAADVLHCQQPLSGFGVLGAAGAAGCPGLYTFHSPAPQEYRMRRGMTHRHRPGVAGRAAQALLWLIERGCLRRAAAIQTLSASMADLLCRLYGIPRDRVTVIPGGVDVERFHPAADRGAVRRALGLPQDRPLLLTVRNLEARMGLDDLIRSVALVREKIPDLLLLVGGAGSLRASLEALAASLQVGPSVRFLGYIPEADLAGFYQAADAFLLPTRALEGFGLITVEALACGTPVLGTPVGATPEILGPLDPSLLFRSPAPADMAARLQDFVAGMRADPPAHDRLRAACRPYVEARYDWNRVIGRLETLLAKTAESRGGWG